MVPFVVMVSLLLELPRVSRGLLPTERLTTKDGLSQSEVFCITQDAMGYLWLGTEDGLNRYDGHDFTVYRADPSAEHSLPSNEIKAISIDSKGQLWMVTAGGFANGNPLSEEFRQIQVGRPTATAQAIFVSSDDAIWLGTAEGIFTLSSDRHTAYLQTNLSATAFAEICGTLFVGTSNAGVWQFNVDAQEWIPVTAMEAFQQTASAATVNTLFVDPEDTLWIGTDGGLFRFDPHSEKVQSFQHEKNNPTTLSHKNVTAIALASESALWIGTFGKGLNRLEIESGQCEQFGDATHRAIWSLWRDRTGVLWIGASTGGDLLKLPHQRFCPAVEADRVWDFAEDAEGLWVASWDGVNFYSHSGEVQHYRHDPENTQTLSSNAVFALARDKERTLWIATHELPPERAGGLNALNIATGAVTRYPIGASNNQGYPEKRIWSLLLDGRQQLWFGTAGDGLHCFDPISESLTSYTTRNSDLSHDDVWPLLEDERGNLWIGTNGGGLNYWDRGSGTFRHFRHHRTDRNTLGSDQVWALAFDHENRLWIGTHGGGLARLNQQSGNIIRWTTATSAIPNNTVYAILEDNLNRLWISTNAGLAVYIPSSDHFVRFSRTEGLQDTEFNYNAALAAKNGALFFGGTKGFNFFYPEEVFPEIAPTVSLTNLLVSGMPGKRLSRYPKAVQIPYAHNSFSVSFSVFDFQNPRRNQYLYRLAGAETEWTLASTSRAIYTFVPPGEYTFEVRGSDSHGIWSSEPATLSIHIPPPFYMTWWCKSLAVIVLILSLTGLCTAHTRKRIQEIEATIKRNKETARLIRQKQVQERQGISNRLHRGPLQVIIYAQWMLAAEMEKIRQAALTHSLNINAMFFKMPSHFENLEKDLRQVCTDITSGWNDEKGLQEHIEDQIERYASRQPIPAFSINIKNEDLIRQETKRALFWTFQDGTDNILKHANATEVKVSCQVQDDHLRFTLADDGSGFSVPEDLYEFNAKGHLGVLSIVTEVESVGGQVMFHSSPGAGTKIEARFFGWRVPKEPTDPAEKKESTCPPNAMRNQFGSF